MAKLRYLGHSAFEISSKEIQIYIDPFLSESPVKASDIKKADYILVSHDHHDHLGAAQEIAAVTGATVISIPEVSKDLEIKNKLSMNMGSMIELNPKFKVAMVPAFHTSEKGNPIGYVIDIDGAVIYHAGDTAIFNDMALIKELYRPKIALLPIGGYYVMGPKEAAFALTLIEPEVTIPMHYKTFTVLEQDSQRFLQEAKKIAPEVKIVVLKSGETFEYP